MSSEKEDISSPAQDQPLAAEIDVDDGDLITIKDLCKILKCDIKSAKKKELIHNLVCYSFSIVLGIKEYREQIKEARNTTKKIMDIIKLSNFRKELITVLSRQICLRAAMPHYVILFG